MTVTPAMGLFMVIMQALFVNFSARQNRGWNETQATARPTFNFPADPKKKKVECRSKQILVKRTTI